jgi:hypothetical protein
MLEAEWGTLAAVATSAAERSKTSFIFVVVVWSCRVLEWEKLNGSKRVDR